MLFRMLALLAVVVLVLSFNAPSLAEDKAASHDGKVVKVADGKLTMTGKDGKEHSHTVGKTAKVTIDGKDAKLEDLKAGQEIKVTMEKKEVTRIEAKK